MSDKKEDEIVYNGMTRDELNEVSRNLQEELTAVSKKCGIAGIPVIICARIPVLAQSEELRNKTKETITKKYPELDKDALDTAVASAEITQVISGLDGFHPDVLAEMQMAVLSCVANALESNDATTPAADSETESVHPA